MICPNCNIGIRFEITGTSQVFVETDLFRKHRGYDLAYGFCSECEKLIILLRRGEYYFDIEDDPDSRQLNNPIEEIIYPIPKSIARPVEPEVPSNYKNDFIEASLVLPISPKASAAISRRVLQNILRDEYKIQKPSLAQEISEFILKPGIPTHLSQAVDAVRNIGNFAAHPLKDTNTGQVIEVEPGEAEWLLDVLDSLFDFTFVQPERLKTKQAQLNAKLASIGKPPMKT